MDTIKSDAKSRCGVTLGSDTPQSAANS